MSKKKASRSSGGAQVPPGALPGRPAQSPHGAPPTPHRPVVSLALLLFVPALWLVLDGNLSVQTALIRFMAALLVSWVAAWVVFATLASYAGAASAAQAAAIGSPSAPAGHLDLAGGAPVLPE